SPTFNEDIGTLCINTNEPGDMVGCILPVATVRALSPVAGTLNSSTAAPHAAKSAILKPVNSLRINLTGSVLDLQG
ncbi:MAG: hypothetical protein JWS12_12, partial [Candidatus Saccharibacteria bacterium]|nr:hypothetical protein [Candidatus Saccharibacteria bacterium]